MSKKTQQYPSEQVRALDDQICNFHNKVFKEAAKKFKLSEKQVAEIINEVSGKLSPIMSNEYIGTINHPIGFNFVDPRHFKSLSNLRIHNFLEMFVDGEALALCDHELSLMLLEIKELRAVLQQQFNYNWTEHRKHFPLIAQSSI